MNDDLISRRRAIKLILGGKIDEDSSFVECVEECNSMLDWAADEIKALPSARQWIPVTERLPEANEIDEKGFIKAYLVQDARWMDVARWNGENWIAWGYGTVLKNVTAWMPLPTPWKGE